VEGAVDGRFEPKFTDAAACTNDRFLSADKNVTKSKGVLPRGYGTVFFNVAGVIATNDKNDRFWRKCFVRGLLAPQLAAARSAFLDRWTRDRSV
jgi:hypothetical protein